MKTIEDLIKNGESIKSLTGDELWELHKTTSIMSVGYIMIEAEVNRRLAGEGTP